MRSAAASPGVSVARQHNPRFFCNGAVYRLTNLVATQLGRWPNHPYCSKKAGLPGGEIVSYQIVVATFDSAVRATAAVEALKVGGFHPDDTIVFDKNRVGLLREPGLWRRIFGDGLALHEAEVYGQSLERFGVIVAVRVTGDEVAHATGILDIHRPIDVHDRAVTTGIAPADRVEAAAASIAAAPIAAEQRVAVSPKLAEAHDEVLRLAEEQLEVGKRMVEAGMTRVRRFSGKGSLGRCDLDLA
jgi:hypothetical protein